jgi:3-deoxy-manno-octulosonate cytidylyltransferase (CMP-KDO synthetase)
MITAAHPFSDPREAESPHQVKVVLNQKGEALYFSRALIPASRSGGLSRHCGTDQLNRRFVNRRSLSWYLRHQGIYGYTRNLLLRFVRWKTSPEDAEAVAASLCEARERAGNVGRRRVAHRATATGRGKR